jgi:hypothetical protein
VASLIRFFGHIDARSFLELGNRAVFASRNSEKQEVRESEPVKKL